MITPTDFVIFIIGTLLNKKYQLNFTKIQKSTFLLNEYLKSNGLKDLGYSFREFLAHTGPNDDALFRALSRLGISGAIQDIGTPIQFPDGKETRYFQTHTIKLTSLGWTYFKEAEKELKRQLGEENLRKIKEELEEYSKLSERDLIKKANKEWLRGHKEETQIISAWTDTSTN